MKIEDRLDKLEEQVITLEKRNLELQLKIAALESRNSGITPYFYPYYPCYPWYPMYQTETSDTIIYGGIDNE